MNILVVGSGGREHAIAWALRKSQRVGGLFIAPGNAGTASLGMNVPIPGDDIDALVGYVVANRIDLTVVGPEAPLSAGLVDALNAAGQRAFGPTKAAALLEASKAFCKQVLQEANVATAGYAAFSDYDSAIQYLETCEHQVVVKADGLAAGKGVIVCDTHDDAAASLSQILRDSAFGAAGKTVIIEERLTGPELSVLAFCDGKTVVPMPPVRDHKRVGDGDRGPNTGGMGAIAPVTDVDAALLDEITRTVLQPVVDRMAERGTPYKGVLFAGLMLTPNGIKTLEFNARFGDPETQALLPLLDSDLLDIVEACVDGTLTSEMVRWSGDSCAAIVMAAHNYPGDPRKGDAITLPESLPDGVAIFHAGTALAGGQLVTNGGRVLAVTGRGADLNAALDTAYKAVEAVRFDGMHYRRDIGRTDSAYAAAGVDIAAGTRATEMFKAAVRSTYNRAVLSDTGSFGGLYDASALKEMRAPVLVASTDGVGTKTMVAARMGRWDTIGQDLVNHCINDILVQGALPLFFLDYVASSKLQPEQIAAVVSGVAAACKAAGMALLGGETAEMPGVYQPGELDLAGTVIGVAERETLLTGAHIQVGDAVLAFPSSGLHTNGFSLARMALDGLDWTSPHEALGGQSIGEALLAVHRPYLSHVEKLWVAGVEIHGLAHITGGGVIDNLPRVLPDGMGAKVQRGTWPEPPIFGLIAQHAKIAPRELFHAFNMGMGMLVIIPSSDVEKALSVLPDEAYRVGAIVAGEKAVEIENLYG